MISCVYVFSNIVWVFSFRKALKIITLNINLFLKSKYNTHLILVLSSHVARNVGSPTWHAKKDLILHISLDAGPQGSILPYLFEYFLTLGYPNILLSVEIYGFYSVSSCILWVAIFYCMEHYFSSVSLFPPSSFKIGFRMASIFTSISKVPTHCGDIFYYFSIMGGNTELEIS